MSKITNDSLTQPGNWTGEPIWQQRAPKG